MSGAAMPGEFLTPEQTAMKWVYLKNLFGFI
jgi:hypothetical protein